MMLLTHTTGTSRYNRDVYITTYREVAEKLVSAHTKNRYAFEITLRGNQYLVSSEMKPAVLAKSMPELANCLENRNG